MSPRTDPEEAAAIMRAAGVEPIDDFPGVKVPWRCECMRCHHEVTPRLSTVTKGHGACAYCAGKRVHPGDAEAAMLCVNVKPLEPFVSSKHKWPCRCLVCDELVFPRYNSVQRGKGACEYCAARTIGHKLRVPEEQAIEEMRAAGVEPDGPYPGIQAPWPGTCLRCGEPCAPRLLSIRNGQGGCRACGFRASGEAQRGVSKWRGPVRSGVHETTRMLAAGLWPLVPFPGVEAPWPCVCVRCGERVAPRFKGIARGQGGCRACGYKAARQAQLLDEDTARAGMLAAGLDPQDPYVRSGDPWRCKCLECGEIVTPSYNSVQQGKVGCRWCSSQSFSGIPALLYLIYSDEFSSVKVGISRARSRRILRWEQRGWDVIRVWAFDEGSVAQRIERAVLRYWRDGLDAPLGVTQADVGNLDGHTETAPLWAIDLDETVAIIERLIAEVDR